MQIAMIGLGRMGMGMSKRLLKGGHSVVGMDLNEASRAELDGAGGTAAASLDAVVALLQPPRLCWVMLPAGAITQGVLDQLFVILSPGDLVIEGGNSNYKDSIARAERFAQRGIHFMDCGVSGGIWGEANGFNLMMGGSGEAFLVAEPLFRTLAPEHGYLHVGKAGAGHFVKMVHNGIEYGMMQAIAEGFELMAAKEEFDLDLAAIAELWEHGSVVRSWLMELTGRALASNPDLSGVAPYVSDSGEGRWTVQESIDLAVPLPVISLALQMRFRSRQESSYGARMLAAQRNQFGGHAVKKTGD